jgi:hypothetical protein
MGVSKNLAVAATDLDALIDSLEASMKLGGFDNDSDVHLIKGWSKVNVLSGLNLDSFAYWRMKRLPSTLVRNSKRSQVLLHASSTIATSWGHPRSPNGIPGR